MAFLIALVTFLIAVCIIFAIWILAGGGPKQDVVQERLESVRTAERRGIESPDLGIVRDEKPTPVPWLNRVLLNWMWVESLQKFIHQSGLTIKPVEVLLISAVLGVVGYVIAAFFSAGSTFSAVFGLAMIFFPLAFIAIKRSRRLHRFEERFPEALDLLGRAVRAGHAFTTGLELIAEESPAPISEEFRTTFEEQNLGLPLRDTLVNLTERVPLIDVRMFVTALLVQKETGGNLVEILDELARLIRERFRIYREVKIKTAQGRLTAVVLIAMPFIMIALLSLVNSSYIKILFTDSTGQTLLIIAAVLQILGSLILWRIVHIDV
jgi:tight adherence protein B